MSSVRSTSDGRGPVTRKGSGQERAGETCAVTSDVAGSHPPELLSGPCGCPRNHELPTPKSKVQRSSRPGQDYMYPFGVIGVAPRYIPAGAVVELAGFRLSCTSQSHLDAHRYKRNTGRGESDSGSLIPWWSRIVSGFVCEQNNRRKS